jgi:hypothetical protein
MHNPHTSNRGATCFRRRYGSLFDFGAPPIWIPVRFRRAVEYSSLIFGALPDTHNSWFSAERSLRRCLLLDKISEQNLHLTLALLCYFITSRLFSTSNKRSFSFPLGATIDTVRKFNNNWYRIVPWFR